MAFMVPFWYNSGPLYYPDSLGYIFWGLQHKVPPERAGVYGQFIRFVSLGKSLWLPVLLQAFLVGWMLRLVFRSIFGITSFGYLLASGLFLGIFSSLGWTASMLMPDLFCAICSLALGILALFPSRLSTFQRLTLILVLLISSFQHVSIFLINLLILMGLALCFLWEGKFKTHAFALSRLLTLVMLGYVGIGLIHRQLEGSFFVSKSSKAFLLGRLAETGILADYLTENCPGKPLKLCDIRSQLPMGSEYFLWNKASFIHQKGGLHDDQGAYKEVIDGVFSSPRYLFWFAVEGLKATGQQLFMIKAGDGLGGGQKAQLQFFPWDEAIYNQSHQNQGINFDTFNTLIYIGLLISVVAFLTTGSRRSLTPELKSFGIFLLILFVANAAVNGALSTPLHRYQTRVFWLADVWLLAALFPTIRHYFSSDPQSR